jgi:hypothetical protein
MMTTRGRPPSESLLTDEGAGDVVMMTDPPIAAGPASG